MLDSDITLSFESISMKQGHAGSKTRYLAAQHKVIHTSFCTRRWISWLPFHRNSSSRDSLVIPPEVTTESQLRRYVAARRSHWLRRR